MRHYEIVLLVNPNQSAQVPPMVERYRNMIKEGGGIVHRFEDWGRRQLAYPINKIHKAHYVLFNIECGAAVREELENAFRYNDSILRDFILLRREAETGPSPIMKAQERSSREAPQSRERRFVERDAEPKSESASASESEPETKPESEPEKSVSEAVSEEPNREE